MKPTYRVVVCAIAFLFLLCATVYSHDIPKPNGYVNDFTNSLSSSDINALNQKVHKLKADQDIEFGVLLIDTTGSYPIAEYATNVAREWGIGSKEGEHRGLLFVVAKNDRKSFLAVSRQLESSFPDSVASNLAASGRDNFKREQWGAGIEAVVVASSRRAESLVSKAAEQKQTPLAEPITTESTGPPWWFVLIVVIAAVGVAGLVAPWIYVKLFKSDDYDFDDGEVNLPDPNSGPSSPSANVSTTYKPPVYPDTLQPTWTPDESDPVVPEAKPRFTPVIIPPRKKEKPKTAKKSPHSAWSSGFGSSSYGSSGDSSSYDSGSSFGGGGDFGGGGGGDSW